MPATQGENAMRIENGWLVCTACDEPVRANADGSYGCACRRWSGSAFEVELQRLGRAGNAPELPLPASEPEEKKKPLGAKS